MRDLISRQAAINAIEARETEQWIESDVDYNNGLESAIAEINALPSADRPKREWTTEQVAEMLANLFGDECACNYNGIDEWLPSACKYADTQCPDPKEKHGCWMQFLIQGGGDTE